MASVPEDQNEPTEGQADSVLLQYHLLDGTPLGTYIDIDDWEEIREEGTRVARIITDWLDNHNQTDFVDPMFPPNTGYTNAVPDPDTLTTLPWRDENCKRAICELQEPDGSHFVHCSRSILRKVLEDLADMGYEGRAGSEIEFNLLEGFDIEEATGRGAGYIHETSVTKLGAPYTLKPMEEQHSYLTELRQAMKSMGFRLEGIHKEASPGMFEAIIRYSPALQQADTISTFRMAAKSVGRKHGLTPIFLPRPLPDVQGNSQHYHISLWQDGENAFYDKNGDEEVADIAYHFIGGIFEHAAGLTPLCAPTINSYKRLQPMLGAPINKTYGHDNQSCMVRIPTNRGDRTRIELRLPDNAANPYLALAGIFAAGMDGVENEIDPGEPTSVNVYDPSTGNYEQLPTSLSAAIEALENDELLVNTIGEDAVTQFAKLKEDEVTRFNQAVTDWEIREYITRL